ncbi:hypothetical protein [Aquiflexum lacus]|uniref:hypothetical protein n=1 Tax=Aquiflexum lacus TaxID=2483805 RepID=UPI001E3F87A1|nr:hypothetical protein [Aquiflexum lacus]
MKNLRITWVTVFIFFSLSLSPVLAVGKGKTPVESTMTPVEIEVLKNRLEEIKKMDKSSLTKAERIELRKELRETKKEITRNNGGVYLSVGALILVIVLLILLL